MRPYSSDPFRDNQQAAALPPAPFIRQGGQKARSQFGAKPTLANTGIESAIKAMASRQAQEEQGRARQAARQQEREHRVALYASAAQYQVVLPFPRPVITAPGPYIINRPARPWSAIKSSVVGDLKHTANVALFKNNYSLDLLASGGMLAVAQSRSPRAFVLGLDDW